MTKGGRLPAEGGAFYEITESDRAFDTLTPSRGSPFTPDMRSLESVEPSVDRVRRPHIRLWTRPQPSDDRHVAEWAVRFHPFRKRRRVPTGRAAKTGEVTRPPKASGFDREDAASRRAEGDRAPCWP